MDAVQSGKITFFPDGADPAEYMSKSDFGKSETEENSEVEDSEGEGGEWEDSEEEDGDEGDSESAKKRREARERRKAEEEAKILRETIYHRLVALKDIIPIQQRVMVSNFFRATYGLIFGTVSFGGKSMWVLSTSAIMLGVPYALAVAEEQQMVEMEKEMQMQQRTTESLTPGAQTILSQPAAHA
ncbi:mitochondrial import receptor subunit Tom22 [Rhizina undulata]